LSAGAPRALEDELRALGRRDENGLTPGPRPAAARSGGDL